MERAEMIRRLTEATLESVLSDPDRTWLRTMLEKGFAGYASMSAAGLAREMQLRGLLDFDEPEPAEDFDDDEDLDEDDLDDDAPGMERIGTRVFRAGHRRR